MKRFPKSTNHAIAGLMFLRFFCPALSTFDSKTVWPGGLPKVFFFGCYFYYFYFFCRYFRYYSPISSMPSEEQF